MKTGFEYSVWYTRKGENHKQVRNRISEELRNEDNGFYRLSMEYGNVDNPDERIGQNIASFTHFSIKLTTGLLKDFLNITMSSMKLYAMSPILFYILAAVSVIYTLVSIGCFAGPEQSE